MYDFSFGNPGRVLKEWRSDALARSTKRFRYRAVNREYAGNSTGWRYRKRVRFVPVCYR